PPRVSPRVVSPAVGQGDFGFRVLPSSRDIINPNPLVAPGLTLRQWAYNQSVINSVYAQIPPYFFGYNPYPQVVNFGPVFRYPTTYVPTGFSVNPNLFGNPFAFAGNPLAFYGNPYAIYGTPYLFP